MTDENQVKTFTLSSGHLASFVGPDIAEGPLPAVFYFALSAEESLSLDPYNQPVAYLSSFSLRVFSLTLPAHQPPALATRALSTWAEEIASGHNPLTSFIQRAREAIEELTTQGIILPEKCAVAGLSRGAFIAAHIAAQLPQIRWILGYAPLTELSATKEFHDIEDDSLVQSLNLNNLIHTLCDRHVRFYIGNLDLRVGTRHCFNFIENLSQAALAKRIRSPKIELLIGPSIGHLGHGTSKEVFHSGAQWLIEQLGVISHD